MRLVSALAVVAVGLQVVAALTAHADLPQAVADGFNAGRSGNIVLRSVHHKATDAVAALIDDSHYYFASAETEAVPRSLPLKNVADVRARSLGLATPNPQSATAFVHNDLFRRPIANVLLSVESLGEESVATYGLDRVRAVLNRYPTMSLHDESYPPSAVSTAATLATGATPAEHGIVGGAWKHSGKKVAAYSSSSSWSQRATTADVLAQTFEGQPLLLSVSADAQHANAFGVNPSLDAHTTRNAVNVALKDGSFRPLQHSATFSESFAAKQSDLLNALSSTGLFSGSASSGVSVDVRELAEPTRRVTVRYPATKASGASHTESVTFDMHHHEEAAFFAELMYVESMSPVLRTHKLASVVGDTVPDLITVSLTGLTGIIEKHGRGSPQAVAAMHLLDVAVPQLLEQLTSVYGDRAVSQLVLLGSHRSFADAVDPRDVFATVARLLPSQDVKQFYPQVYVEAGASVADVCRVLSTELDKLQFDVYCPQPAAPHMAPTALFQLSESTVFAANLKATNSTGGSSVFRYQIVLWLSIVLALFVLGATYSLAWMSFKKDTLLYSTFNPNWEQRKRS